MGMPEAELVREAAEGKLEAVVRGGVLTSARRS